MIIKTVDFYIFNKHTMKKIYHFAFFITFVSSCLATFIFPVSAQTIGSGSATISENDHTNIEGGHLGTSSIVQGGVLRYMTVTIASGEQSKTRMRGGTAGVNETPDTGSDWNTEGNYDKQPSVQFRGKQRGGIKTKEYFPEFHGTVEYFGEGGGEEKTYSWSVNAKYEVKDIEIHQSVAGGEFVKISDEQNVDPIIAGQKIQLKVVAPPIGLLGNDYTVAWTIGGVAHVKKYTFNSQSASVEQLEGNSLKVNPITYFYIDGGTTTNEKNTSVAVKITKTGMTPINKSVSFKILKPKVDLLNATWTTANPEVGVRNIGGVPTLTLGDASNEGISWQAIVTPPAGR
ncbi:MAG: hypothetical protein LBE12_02025 [Planctomycetaceae bacterium]|jgi:hypothetical protein|nr:hypothetical protein [Planctomycetaceae bacterium]